jgi:acyl-CoA synthetase (AMP-forming)/AMP-acid ligase II
MMRFTRWRWSAAGIPNGARRPSLSLSPLRAQRPTLPVLDAHCREHIARFKRLKQYVFIDALPKNNYGKVLKTELRERLTTQDV